MDLNRHSAREDASQWLAKLERGLRHDEGPALRNWLKRSAHRTAILEVARRQAAPDVMALLSELFPISLHTLPERPRRGPLAFTAAIIVASCVLGTGIWMFTEQQVWTEEDLAAWTHPGSYGPGHPPVIKRNYSTSVGQQRRVELPDGSVMTLNTGSNVSVFYSLRQRDVHLTRGEVSFSVAHESERPFVVSVGREQQLQATGTQFDVRLRTSDMLDLIVTDGQVTLLYKPQEDPDTAARARLRDHMIFGDATIEASEMVQVESGLQFVRKLDTNDLEDALAWQRGRIVFKGVRLEEALAELDRYIDARFVLFDDRLRDLLVTGEFSTRQIDDFLVSLRQNYQIEALRRGDGRIALRPLPAAAHLPRQDNL